MKKIVSSFLIIAFIICLATGVNAYSSNEFTIDVPSTYKEEEENSFKKDDGTSIGVKITEEKGSTAVNFTEEELNYFTNEVLKSFESYKQNLKEELKKEKGDSVTDAQIEETIKNFKWNIEKKEITTVTKNNYKCFHILSNIIAGNTSYYANQYSIVTDNKFYTLTVNISDKSALESEEIKNIIDSFTIVNYKAPKGSKSSSTTSVIAAVVVAVVAGILGVIRRKLKGR